MLNEELEGIVQNITCNYMRDTIFNDKFFEQLPQRQKDYLVNVYAICIVNITCNISKLKIILFLFPGKEGFTERSVWSITTHF